MSKVNVLAILMLFFLMNSTCIAAEVSLRSIIEDYAEAELDKVLDKTKIDNETKSIRYGDYEINLTRYTERAKNAGSNGLEMVADSIEVDEGNVTFNSTEFKNRALKSLNLTIEESANEETKENIVEDDNQTVTVKAAESAAPNNQTEVSTTTRPAYKGIARRN